MSKKKKALTICLSVTLVIGILITGCAAYLGIYYEASPTIAEDFPRSELITVDEGDKFTAFVPSGTYTVGFIFYPGGKVDEAAYYPLLQSLAEYGILSAVAKMPFRLAVLDSDAADGIKEAYPDINDWYIGGHSLGGAIAASHLSKNENEFKGLVLLGAYSTKDLSGYDVSVLSIYGTNDGVMNRKKYKRNLSNMPLRFSEYIIDGGNHAYFGAYGEQRGDGEAAISDREQLLLTATQIYLFISSQK